MNEWMQILSRHYHQALMQRNEGPLVILFDIDGTILDMRFTIHGALKKFDEDHGTGHFRGITVRDIDFHEEHIRGFLERLQMSEDDQLKVLHRYERLLMSMVSNPRAYVPFEGVFEVIKWFQEKPGTFVGLNTGRFESLREDTLASLNALGVRYGVTFSDDLLFMRPESWQGNITSVKTEGIRHFVKNGYRVFAFIDNEPENLRAVADMGDSEGILLLHADTIFKSDFLAIPGHAVRGRVYDIYAFMNSRHETEHVPDDDGLLKRTA